MPVPVALLLLPRQGGWGACIRDLRYILQLRSDILVVHPRTVCSDVILRRRRRSRPVTLLYTGVAQIVLEGTKRLQDLVAFGRYTGRGTVAEGLSSSYAQIQ